MSHILNCANYLVLFQWYKYVSGIGIRTLTKFSIRCKKKKKPVQEVFSCNTLLQCILCVINAPYFLYFFLQICIKILEVMSAPKVLQSAQGLLYHRNGGFISPTIPLTIGWILDWLLSDYEFLQQPGLNLI